MKTKHLLITLLALWMSATANAYTTEIDGIYYNISGTTAEVTYATSSYNSYSGDVVIPSSISYSGKTYPVTKIGYRAFKGSTRLLSLVLPASIVEWGLVPFEGCTGLVTIDMSNCQVTEIPSSAFENLTSLESILLPSNITSIPGGAFSGCNKLSYVVIPNSVTSINGSAFKNCSSLTSITIPESVTTIGTKVFEGCSSLTDVTFSDGTTSLSTSGKWFCDCTSLKNLYLGRNISYDTSSSSSYNYNNSPFYQSAFENLIIEPTVTTITDYEFYSCRNLKTIECGNITSIGKSAFYGCSSLEEVILPETLETIGEIAFYGCSSLNTLYIPNSVTSIGTGAFSYNQNALQHIFVDWATPLTLSSDIFESSTFSNAILYVPYSKNFSILNAYKANSKWGQFTRIAERDAFSLTVTNAGLATLYDDRALMIPEDNEDILGVYYVKEIRDGVVTLGKMKDFIPAYTGAIIMANPGTYSFHSLDTDYEISDNLLEGVTEPTSIATLKANGGYSAILTLGRGKTGGYVGLYNYTGSTLGANQCYIGYTGDPNEFMDAEMEYVATGINIQPSTVKIPIGGSMQIQAKFTPEETSNKSLTWTSSNDAIATVDARGSVTAVALGNCTITATTQDGSDLSASVNVSVISDDDITLTDGEPYIVGAESLFDDLSYTRTFSNTNWQALYVPFSMSYADWSTNFDMARINDVHQFDDDDDGIMEVTALEVANLKAGSHTEPNTPYLIRAKVAGTYTLIPTDKTLFPAEENSFEVTSWNNTFTFTGTYSGLSGTEMVANNYYAMGGGTLKRATDTAYGLVPYRWYMEVTDRYGNPVNLGEVKVMCLDDEWEETGIDELTMENGQLTMKNSVYDLSGRKLSNSKF